MLGDSAVMIAFYWLTLWTYGGLWLLSLSKRRVNIADVSLAFPLGAGVFGLTTLMLWMAGIDFQLTASVIEVLLVLTVIRTVQSVRFSIHWFSSHVDQLWRSFMSLFAKKMLWSAAVLWGVVAFSLGVMTVWQLMVEPVTWDAITLYDFRAWRLTEGWLPVDFFRQFTSDPSFFGYDFLHPFLPSVLSAFVYKSGGSHTPVINLALLLCVLMEAWKTFRLTIARLTFAVLFLGSPLFINAAVEGYGAWTATLFWFLFFLLFLRIPKLPAITQYVAGVLLAAATQSRLSEPYWLIVGALLVWKRKFTILLPTVLWFSGWQLLIKQAAGYGVRGDGGISLDLSRWTQLAELFFVFFLKNQVVPYITVSFVAAYLLWKGQALKAKLLELLLVLVGWMALIFIGLTYFFLLGGSLWSEVQFSLPRAVLPLAAGCVVFTAAALDRLQSRKSLVH